MDSRTLVKVLCAQAALTYKKVAEILAKKTGGHYTKTSVSSKLAKDTFRFSEAFILADALGYDLVPVKRKG